MKKSVFSKILACALVVAMVMSLSFTSVFADYEQIEKEEGGVVYSEDFSDLELYPASDYINLRNSDGEWEGDEEKQIGNSDWYIVKAPDGDPLGSTLGVMTGHDEEPAEPGREIFHDYLGMTGESVDVDTYYYRRASLQYKNQDVLDMLTNTYSISYTIDKSIMVDNILKFGGPDVNNCYRLAILGAFGKGGPLWILDRMVNGSSIRIAESDTTYTNERGIMDTSGEEPVRVEAGAIHSDTSIKVIVVDNSSIEINIDGQQYENVPFKESKKIVLASPITTDAPDCVFAFGADYAGVMANRIFNFELANYVEVGEADNGIYADIATDVDASGYMVLDQPAMISSIVNNGSESTTVLLSEDGIEYKKLADIDGQTKFVNDLTGAKYQFVRLVGSKDVSIYTPLGATNAVNGVSTIKARINGEDIENPVFKTSDNLVAICVGNKFIPLRSGDVTISVDDILEYPVTVLPAFADSIDFTAIKDIDSGETSVELNADNAEDGIFVADGWTYGFLDEARRYVSTYQTFSTISVGGGMTLTSYPLDRQLQGAPILYKSNLPAELGKNFKIRFNANKNSVTSGLGFRFMIHNDGQNFYLLHLAGLKEDTYTYVFEKYVDGVCEASFEGPELDEIMSYSGRFGNQSSDFEITYEDGEINWKFNAKRQGGNNENYYGYFYDEAPFAVNVEDTTLGFNVNASSGGRQATISSFSIQAIDSPLVAVNKNGACAYSVDPSVNEEAKVYVAEYDTTGRLVGIASGDQTAGYIIKSAENKFKAFIFSGHDTLKPLMDYYDFDQI